CHSVSPGIVVRRSGLRRTGERAPVRIADERELDILALDRPVGVPSTVLPAEAGRLVYISGRQDEVQAVRIGRQLLQGRGHDVLNRVIGQSRALTVAVDSRAGIGNLA